MYFLFFFKLRRVLMRRMHIYRNLHLPGVFVFQFVNFIHLLSCIRCFIYFNYCNAKCLGKLQGLNQQGQGTLRLSNLPREWRRCHDDQPAGGAELIINVPLQTQSHMNRAEI